LKSENTNSFYAISIVQNSKSNLPAAWRKTYRAGATSTDQYSHAQKETVCQRREIYFTSDHIVLYCSLKLVLKAISTFTALSFSVCRPFTQKKFSRVPTVCLEIVLPRWLSSILNMRRCLSLPTLHSFRG
jgi:hypothetical protein